MSAVELFITTHPLLPWLAAGAVLLAMELHTGSGWLLWPAGSAAVTGLASLFDPQFGPQSQIALFAVLTIISTYLGRRFVRPRLVSEPDINDALGRLVGHHGKAVGDFVGSRGRVFVDGKEWSAESEGAAPIAKDQSVVVVVALSGARVQVRAG